MPYIDLAKRKKYHRGYMRGYIKNHPQTYTTAQKNQRKARQKLYDNRRNAAGYHLTGEL